MSNQVLVSPISQGNSASSFGLSGLPTVSVNVRGTISGGNYVPQVSNDGVAWEDIQMFGTDGVAFSVISVAGIYRADVNGYQAFRLHASGGFAGTPTVQYFGYPTPMMSLLTEGLVNNALIAPSWQAGTYDANSVVFHDGSFWVADVSTSDEPGPATDWTEYTTLAALFTYILNLF